MRWQHLNGRQKTHVFYLDRMAAPPFGETLLWLHEFSHNFTNSPQTLKSLTLDS
jgi:hypothetical protein